MSICKKVPQLHFDRADPTEPEASLSTYKIKSPSQISNSLPEDHNAPSISEILFGDSDHENNSAQNHNRIKPVNSQGCFVRVVKKSAKSGAKPASFQGVNVKDKNLDIDPDDMFDNFGSMFSVRFMSDEEYKKTVEKQGVQQQHLRRELLPEFAKEEVKPKPVKTVIRLKRRTSDHPTNNNNNTTNNNNNANNGEQKTTAQLLKPISTLNTKLPVLGPVETEQSFSRELTNKSRDYRIRKTSREKLLTPLMNLKGKLELKSRDKSQDVIRQNVSQNIIKDNDVSDIYSLNDIRPRSRGNSRILKDLSSSKIVETEMSPKLEDIPKITKQILKDITNYNHKAFKPYFPFENSHRENKENEQRKTETGHIVRLQVPQEEYFTNRETVPARNFSLPRDFESNTNRSYQEQARTGPKFFVKNAKATLDIPRHPGNVSQRPSYVKEEPSITSRTDNHQQMGNIKTRERKTLTKVVHPPLKLKVKNPNQIKKDIPIPSKGSSRMGVQKNPVLNYVKIVNEIWGKDGKRAISVPKRVY